MASGDTKTNQYLDIAANGSRADLPTDTCCETRTQTLTREVAERIITEEETRAREDAILQNEIDEIKNSPDVVDIVATYADLQNYDTTHLGNNDVIRVLADETHQGQSAYYRFTKNPNTWTFIGTVGDYYTKNQVDTLLDGKQDTLTAGENIAIDDESGALVISATDTTYSNFVGTDGTTAGTAGLVPAPATTDAGKFLKADGTWDTAGSVINVVQTTGTSTTDVMSQNAVTSMVFANPSNASKIRIGNISTNGDRSISLGYQNQAASNYAVSIGDAAHADGLCSVALGGNAYASAQGSVAIGRSANATVTGQFDIGSTATSYGYNNSNYRLLTGLYDGQSAHDAATYGQLSTAILNGGTTAPTTATVGAVGTLYSYVDTTGATPEPHLMVCTVADTVTPSYTWVEAGGSGQTVTPLSDNELNDLWEV